MASGANNQNWFAELFPPAFTYQQQDEGKEFNHLDTDEVRPIAERFRQLEEYQVRMDKLVSKRDKYGTETLRNIYTKVLAEERAHRQVIDSSAKSVDAFSQTDIVAVHPNIVSFSLGKQPDSHSSSNIPCDQENWFIKDTLKREQQDYLLTKSALAEATEEAEDLKLKYERLIAEMSHKDKKYLVREARINRLVSANDVLANEIVRVSKQLSATQTELDDLQKQYQQKCTEEKQLSSDLSAKKIECKLQSDKMDRMAVDFQQESMRVLDAAQIEHESAMERLSERLEELERESEREKEIHSRCKNGMQQLLLHYSQSNDINSIVQD